MFELVRSPDFADLPLIVEDFVKDNGGSYTGKFAESLLPKRRHWMYITHIELLQSWLVNYPEFQKCSVLLY